MNESRSQEYVELSTAYGQFLAFRDDPAFLKHGFTANSPHAGWLEYVKNLERRPGYSKNGPHLLAMLAIATKQHGQTSESAQKFTAKFEHELRHIQDTPPTEPNLTPAVQTDFKQTSQQTRVSILYTGDTQGVLYPQPDQSSSVGGIARRLPLLAKLRQALPHVVLVDAGDVFSAASNQTMRNNSILVTAMNRMGYDAMGLGPHEMALGEDHLRKLLGAAKFPVVCSNLKFSSQKPWIAPYTIIEREGIKIALLSLMPMPSAGTSAFHGAEYIPSRQALDRYLPLAHDAADLIVVLTQHGDTEIKQLLNKSDDVDVVICDGRGHISESPPYILPALSKGRGLGFVQMETGDGQTWSYAAQSMHLLTEPNVDKELQHDLERVR